MHIRTCLLAALLTACGSSTPEATKTAEPAATEGQAPAPNTSKAVNPTKQALERRRDIANMAEAPAGAAAEIKARRNAGMAGIAKGQYDALKTRLTELDKSLSDENKKKLEPHFAKIRTELEAIGKELAKPGSDGEALTNKLVELHMQTDSAVARVGSAELAKGQWTNPNAWPEDGEGGGWPSAVNPEDLPPEVREFVEALQAGQEQAPK